MNTIVKFMCQRCGNQINARPPQFGRRCKCPACGVSVMVPQLVSQSEKEKPTVLPAWLPKTPGEHKALTVYSREDDLEDIPTVLPVVRGRQANARPPARMENASQRTVPVELRLGQLGGFKTNVDQKTANDSWWAVLGGALVSLGMVVVVILTGGRRMI